MTYLSYVDAVHAGFPQMRMYNKAGHLVSASAASVQAAMSDFQPYFAQSNFSVDILDAPGPDSYPISYMTFITINRNVSAYDCSIVEELLEFIAWVHTNDG